MSGMRKPVLFTILGSMAVLALGGCAASKKSEQLIVEKHYLRGRLMEEAAYKDGKRHGISRQYDSNGNIVKEYLYKNGKLIKAEVP